MPFTTSLNGLANAQTELGVISNNLANANTDGFKKSSVNFADIVAGSAYTNPRLAQGNGSMLQSIDQNFSSGAIQQTGSALDAAVNGQGFFAVKSPLSGQMQFTRNGNFSMDSSGFIVDTLGNRVQLLPATGTSTTPADGQIPLTNSAGSAYASVAVQSDGSVTAAYADGSTTAIGKLALASFISPTGLLQVGNQDWQASGISGAASYNLPGTSGMGNILTGSLEGSNVDVSSELVNLISAQQYFQANSKAISTTSQMITDIMNATSG
jgi:flagellar hook protein FlgE